MPGTSGLLSPFSDMKGLYFDESEEPDDFLFRLNKDLEKIYDKKGINYIKLDFENKDDFYSALVDMQKFNRENIRVSGTSREGHYEVVIDKDPSEDETTSENENGDESNIEEKNE